MLHPADTISYGTINFLHPGSRDRHCHLLAITEKHPVHAIVYLVTSFFALAVIFYLLAAPLIAVFEVIIYAGAVMVLFMFVIMMLDQGSPEEAKRPTLTHCLPALVLADYFRLTVATAVRSILHPCRYVLAAIS